MLSLRCCTQAFRCSKQGLLLLRRMDTRHAGFSICGKGLSCSMAWGIFQYQGSNWCPLHWQGDSQPLTTRKVPRRSFLMLQLGSNILAFSVTDVKLLDLSQLGACMGSSELLLMPSPVGTSRCSSLEWGSPPPVAIYDLCQPLSVTAPHLEGSSVGQDPFIISPGQLPLLRIWECGAHTL